VDRAFADRFVALRQSLASFVRGKAAANGPEAPMLAEAEAGIAGLEPPAERDEPLRLPGCRHLPAALATAKQGPLGEVAAAFEALEPDMRWVQTEHYRKTLGDDHMANYAYTNLVGWRGLVPHQRIAAGFVIIGPGRHYPDHHHEAEEVYVPFCGDTLWGQDGGEPMPREPGSTIHHPPWRCHAMTTRGTPLFALYLWRGPVLQMAQLVA